MQRLPSLILTATLLADLACGSKVNPGTDGSTHFWLNCTTDAECGSAGECICGHCTTECDRDTQCTHPSSRCELASSRLDCSFDESICVPDDIPSENAPDASVEGPDASVEIDASLESVSLNQTTSAGFTDIPSVVTSEPTTDVAATNPTASGSTSTGDNSLTACLDTPGCAWTSLPRAPFTMSSTVARDSKFYALAGNYYVTELDAGPSSLSSTPEEQRIGNFVYDVATEQWSTLAPPPDNLWPTNAWLIGNEAYLPKSDGHVFIYDIDADTWSEGTEVPDALTGAGSQAVGDSIYFFGGYHAGSDGDSSSGSGESNLETYVYTPESDTWQTVADAPGPVHGVSCAWNDRLFVFQDPNYDTPSQSGVTWIYNTTSDSWSTGAPRPNVYYQQYCVTLGDGLYVMGGYDSDSSSYTVTRYQPSTNTWAEVGVSPGLVWSPPQVIDGAVFVVGRYKDNEEHDSELWRFQPNP